MGAGPGARTKIVLEMTVVPGTGVRKILFAKGEGKDGVVAWEVTGCEPQLPSLVAPDLPGGLWGQAGRVPLEPEISRCRST